MTYDDWKTETPEDEAVRLGNVAYDRMDLREECQGCGGAGERCSTCSEAVDNCECSDDGSTWYECSECNGTGEVE